MFTPTNLLGWSRTFMTEIHEASFLSVQFGKICRTCLPEQNSGGSHPMARRHMSGLSGRTLLRIQRCQLAGFLPRLRALAELTRHAHLLAQEFPSVHSIEFRCEWVGLQGREIWDPGLRGAFYYPGQVAHCDRAITVAECSPAELAADWPQIVSRLGAPVRRLFNPSADFSHDWVAQQNLNV